MAYALLSTTFQVLPFTTNIPTILALHLVLPDGRVLDNLPTGMEGVGTLVDANRTAKGVLKLEPSYFNWPMPSVQ